MNEVVEVIYVIIRVNKLILNSLNCTTVFQTNANFKK